MLPHLPRRTTEQASAGSLPIRYRTTTVLKVAELHAVTTRRWQTLPNDRAAPTAVVPRRRLARRVRRGGRTARVLPECRQREFGSSGRRFGGKCGRADRRVFQSDLPRPASDRQAGTQTARTRAGATGLEPATSGVTGRRSNQLNYAPVGRRIVAARFRTGRGVCAEATGRRARTSRGWRSST